MRVPRADPGGRRGEMSNDGQVNRMLAHLLVGLWCQIHHERSATALEGRPRKYEDGPVHQESRGLTQSWSLSERYGCAESGLCRASLDGFSRYSPSVGRCQRSDRQTRSKGDPGVLVGDPEGNTPAMPHVSVGKNEGGSRDGISPPDGPAPARDS